jgi:hypothetical protein
MVPDASGSKSASFPKNEMEDSMNRKPLEHSPAGQATVSLPGTVEKIIPSIDPSQSEKAQIDIEGADELYKEIRVENILQDDVGNSVSLKNGAEVEITIKADPEATTPKK